MEIEILVHDDGTLEIQGYNLPPGIPITQIAKFITDVLGAAIEQGHKHQNFIGETITENVEKLYL